jgi:hypothetical protein
MIIRNGLLVISEIILALVIYEIILIPWILGKRVDLSRWYRPVYWLDGQRYYRCKNCGFVVQRRWNFCPRCTDTIQPISREEIERKIFAYKLNSMFKVKVKQNLRPTH